MASLRSLVLSLSAGRMTMAVADGGPGLVDILKLVTKARGKPPQSL